MFGEKREREREREREKERDGGREGGREEGREREREGGEGEREKQRGDELVFGISLLVTTCTVQNILYFFKNRFTITIYTLNLLLVQSRQLLTSNPDKDQ